MIQKVIFVTLLTTVISVPLIDEDDTNLEFLILHNNDMHARFEQISQQATKCLPEDAAKNKCYGGFARTAHEIRQFRQEAQNGGTPVLYLNAGDTYTGTPWFSVFRENITAAFLNILSPDAISLGNHEFDEGTENLVQFLNEVDFPVLTTNLDLTHEPLLRTTKSLKNSTVFTIKGTKVGVIGYLTPDTKNLAKACDVEFFEEIVSINNEAKKLKSEGVNIIIALGHSGYLKDQAIAKNCPEVDIVIGGHTNTFLYNGKQPDIEVPEAPYPKVIKQASGKEVPVVQAFAYTKYLGRLHVKFDKKGNLVNWDGEPILLNGTIPEDSDVLQLLEVYRPNITALETEIIGYTKVPLIGGGDLCREEECNLGNLIADSYVFIRVKELHNNKSDIWTDAAIGLIQGGGIRAGIEKRANGGITLSDILTTMPFRTEMYMATLSGKSLRKALEHSGDCWDKDSNGAFLQMSGLQVVYDMAKKEGSRLKSAKVLCADCAVPIFSDLQDNRSYNVILSEFLLNGGDGFDFSNATEKHKLPLLDHEFLVEYLKDRAPVYPGIEGRIILENAKHSNNANMFISSFVVVIMCVIVNVLN